MQPAKLNTDLDTIFVFAACLSHHGQKIFLPMMYLNTKSAHNVQTNQVREPKCSKQDKAFVRSVSPLAAKTQKHNCARKSQKARILGLSTDKPHLASGQCNLLSLILI